MDRQTNALRVVVKVGTSTLTRANGSLNLHSMEHLARTLSDLKGMGHEIILVSSGAIGIGTGKLRELTNEKDCNFVLWVGSKRLIKKRLFDQYIEQVFSI